MISALEIECSNNKRISVGIIDGYPKIQTFVFIRQSHEETYYNGLLLIKIIIEKV